MPYARNEKALVLVAIAVVCLGVNGIEAQGEMEFRRLADENSTSIFISEALDEFFVSIFGSSSVAYDTMAIAAIVAGFLYAFFGAKLVRTTAFLAGMFLGFVGAALLLEATNAENELGNGLYVGIFFACGILGGFITFCCAGWRNVIFVVALSALFVGFLVLIGVGNEVGDNYVVLGLLIVALLAFIFVAYKCADVLGVILSTLIGGALLILGISHFTESIISLNTLITDPESTEGCTDESCLIPVVIGSVVTFFGLLFQTRRYRKSKKRELQSKQSQLLLVEMRNYRERMEAQLDSLDKKHRSEIEQIQANTEAREVERMNTLQRSVEAQHAQHQKTLSLIERKLSAQEKQMLAEKNKAEEEKKALLVAVEKKQQEEADKLRATIQRERDQQAEQDAIMKELEKEKEELEKQLEAERLANVKTEEQLLREEELEREQRIKDKENRELDSVHHATVISLQNEVAESRERIRQFENDIKETNRLAKRIRVPGAHAHLSSDDVEDEEYVNPAVAEMRERAIEFAKLKNLVTKAKSEQKIALKQAKKALSQVDALSKEITKAKRKSRASVGAKSDEELDEQQKQINELEIRMDRARNLVSQYEDFSSQYTTLVQDLVQEVDKFRGAEKRLEAYQAYENAPEGIPIVENDDDGDDEEKRDDDLGVPAGDILEGRVVPPPRSYVGIRSRHDDGEVDFMFLLQQLSRYVFRRRNNRPPNRDIERGDDE